MLTKLEGNIIESILENAERQDGRSPSGLWLKENLFGGRITGEELFHMAIQSVLMAVEQQKTLAETALPIGKKIRQQLGLPSDSRMAIFGGCIVLNGFVCNDVICLRTIKDDNNPLKTSIVIKKKNKELHRELQEGHLPVDSDDPEGSARISPIADWTSVENNGAPLIRSGADSALERATPERIPLVYKALNKLQSQGYKINEPVLDAYRELIKDDDPDWSPFSYMDDHNPQSRKSKLYEAQSILSLAEEIVEEDRTFYHQYNCDFRGRIYPLSKYLHEQSSDNAKGLLLYDNSERLGDEGAYWLAVHTANSMGNDKIPLDKRVDYVFENLDVIYLWAMDPIQFRGWTKMDKTWSTLACAMEWKRLVDWCADGGAIEWFQSSLPIFIDGSNNGLQHLTAMAKDDETAPLVNLNKTECPETDCPGDIYMAVADNVWKKLEELADPANNEKAEWSARIIRNFFREREEIRSIEDNKERKEANDINHEEYEKWLEENKDDIKELWPNFWLDFYDKRRKLVKRPTMTLAYGVTRAGCKEHIFDDSKNMHENLRLKYRPWSNRFSDLVFETLQDLEGPSAMLALFKSLAVESNGKVFCKNTATGKVRIYNSAEECADLLSKELNDSEITLKRVNGRLANNETSLKFFTERGLIIERNFMSWVVPGTNFPVVQGYYKYPTKYISVYMGKRHKRCQIKIPLEEERRVHKSAQQTGAAPNIVHSIDAAHLTMIVANTDFHTTVIHDSYGCHAGNMSKLFVVAREEFVNIYNGDMLKDLLRQFGKDDSMVNYGTLDINDVMESDFAFC